MRVSSVAVVLYTQPSASGKHLIRNFEFAIKSLHYESTWGQGDDMKRSGEPEVIEHDLVTLAGHFRSNALPKNLLKSPLDNVPGEECNQQPTESRYISARSFWVIP